MYTLEQPNHNPAGPDLKFPILPTVAAVEEYVAREMTIGMGAEAWRVTKVGGGVVAVLRWRDGAWRRSQQ